jgi:ubiquinone biosynthesis protein
MLDPAFFAEQLDVAALVPDVYAEFRPMVVQALSFFLKHLSAARLARIMADQASLPPQADLSTRVVHFMHACPALHKLGQVIARHRELDVGFRRRLQRLETMEPSVYMDEVAPVLRRELAPVMDRYRISVGNPLAEASVAVVLPLRWRRGVGGEEEGVAKVLKPGVVEDLREDLEILGKLADHLDGQRVHSAMPSFEYRDTFDDVRELLTHEIDFAQEQANLAAASRAYAQRRDVQIPSRLPFSTPHVTAMQRVHGVKVTDLCTAGRHGGSDNAAAGACRWQRRRLCETMAGALIGDVIFSREAVALFHADPHAGNLFAGDDGRLAVLDWSLTGQLRREDREQITQILVGALALDARRILASIATLSRTAPDETLMRRLVDGALARVRRGQVPGVKWLMDLLDRLAKGAVRFPTDLLLFRKAYFTLEGVIQDVCPECSLESILGRLGVSEFVGELPARLLRPPDSRDFATHLSNADLMQIAARTPLNIARIWSEAWMEWAQAVRGE